jgi:hypothetical protein
MLASFVTKPGGHFSGSLEFERIPNPVASAPFFLSHKTTAIDFEERAMISNRNPLATFSAQEILEQMSARTGFSPAELEVILDSELDTDELLLYFTAVASKRMN